MSRTRNSLPPYVRFTQTWGNKPGKGRWYKRRAAKAERRLGKAVVRFGDGAYRHNPVAHIGSECHWKGW